MLINSNAPGQLAPICGVDRVGTGSTLDKDSSFSCRKRLLMRKDLLGIPLDSSPVTKVWDQTFLVLGTTAMSL